MRMYLHDGASYDLSSEQADSVMRAINRGAKFVKVDKDYISASSISKIVKGGGQNNQPTRLDQPDHRGEHSPQKEKIRQMMRDKGLLK